MRRTSLDPDWVRRLFCVAGVVGAAALCLDSKANVLTGFHIMNTAKTEDDLTAPFHSRLDDEGAMPELDGAVGWLNSPPLTRQSLRGKVVLINFWTFTCINSLRPMPYLQSWAAKYRDAGFVIVGVHTPEFSFEHDSANVENEVRRLDIAFPVPIDSKYKIWQAFKNQYWPAQYLADAKGGFAITTSGKAITDRLSAPSRTS